MKLNAVIPHKKSFSTSLEKVNGFIPPAISETAPLLTEFVTFTRGHHVMLKVFPFKNNKYGYVICAECSWPIEQARWLKHSPDKKQTVFSKLSDGSFALVISEQPEATRQFFE